MDDYFASIPLGDSTTLCVGTITHGEADAVQSDGEQVTGFGYYLFLADAAQPMKPIEVLGSLLSPAHAAKLVALFNAPVTALAA